MDAPPAIRAATAADAAAISALACATAIAIGETSARLFESIAAPSIETRLIAGKLAGLVAEAGGEMVGVLIIQAGCHVKYFFVSPQRQRAGIGRTLWREAQARGLVTADKITVGASLFAVPVYEKFGFTAAGPVTEFEGLRYQPMERFASDTTSMDRIR